MFREGKYGFALNLLKICSILLVGLVFSVGITNGHIGLDDWGYTSGCPFVKDGLTLSNVSRAWTDFGYGAIWMPVTFMSYMLDVTLFGDNWYAYHAVNVFLHMVNFTLVCMLIRALLRRFAKGGELPIEIFAIAGGLIWALHPMRAEGVTFVAARKEELWSLFALCSSLAYLKFLDSTQWRHYFLVFAFCLLSFLSKPTAICLPFILLLLFLVIRKKRVGKAYHLMPLVALAVAVGFVTLLSQSHPTNGATVDIYDTTVLWRIVNAIVSVGLYLWYFIWPNGIHIDYMAVFNGWPTNGTLGLTVFIGAATGCIVLFRKLKGDDLRCALAALFMFLLSLGPTLGVLGYVNGDQSMADRYSYFPHIAISLAIAHCLLILFYKTRRIKTLLVASLCFIAYEIAFAIPVVKSYENGLTVSLRAIEKDDENWRALRTVGNEYCARLGRYEEGVAMLRKSLRIRASKNTADSLAYILAVKGSKNDFVEVMRLGASTLKNPLADKGGMMLDALAIVSMREGRYKEAASLFDLSVKAPQRNHSLDHSLFNYALCLSNIGERDSALRVLDTLTSSRDRSIAKHAEDAIGAIVERKRSVPFKWQAL